MWGSMLRRLFRFKHKCGIRKLLKSGIQVGRNTLIFNEAEDYGCSSDMVTIGSNCVVTSGVKFITNPAIMKYAVGEDESSSNRTAENRIIIHDNCFLGLNSIIYPNVAIGPNAVVGAGAVVMQDVPPDMCVCGNPSRVTCSMDLYKSICKRSVTLNYTSQTKRQVLQRYFWEDQNPAGLR